MDGNIVIERCLAGEMEAYGILVRKYQSHLVFFLYYLKKNGG